MEIRSHHYATAIRMSSEGNGRDGGVEEITKRKKLQSGHSSGKNIKV